MRKLPLLLACLLALATLPAPAQDPAQAEPQPSAPVYTPRSIQFRGAPLYAQADLLAAADLKPGSEYTMAQMSAHGKQLMDTGLFSKLSYSFSGGLLVYTLTPSPDLIAIKNVNLPLPIGKELDTLLHTQIPLYHGKVPGEGGVCEQVRLALEKMLANKGIAATVQAAAIAGADGPKTPLMNFSIATPAVSIGAITLNGAPATTLAPEAGLEVDRLTGTDFDRTASLDQITAAVTRLYNGKACVDAKITVKMLSPNSDATGIHVPFAVTVDAHKPYTLTGIRLAPGLLVTQAEFDKNANLHIGDPADAHHVQSNLAFIERRYHSRGRLAAKIHALPTLDRIKSTVRYRITVDPGPVYTMGKIKVEGVRPETSAAILSEWKLKPGAVFNEDAILQFYATTSDNQHPVCTATNCRYNLALNDDHTVDVTFRMATQSDPQ
jgi:outer membrane protein assembly factor BamA